jgi:hypothetical protein
MIVVILWGFKFGDRKAIYNPTGKEDGDGTTNIWGKYYAR